MYHSNIEMFNKKNKIMVLDLLKSVLFGGGVFVCAIAIVAFAVCAAVFIVFKTEDTVKSIKNKL